MGIFSFFNISIIASSEPIVSHLRITPNALVLLIKVPFTSDSIKCRISFSSSLFRRTYKGLPANTPSKSGDTILKPAAEITSVTDLNLSRGSRISSKGFGRSKALTLVTTISSRFATMIVSPCLIVPSNSIILAEGPRPSSSLISRMIPLT